jgi:hypothetical protein
MLGGRRRRITNWFRQPKHHKARRGCVCRSVKLAHAWAGADGGWTVSLGDLWGNGLHRHAERGDRAHACNPCLRWDKVL